MFWLSGPDTFLYTACSAGPVSWSIWHYISCLYLYLLNWTIHQFSRVDGRFGVLFSGKSCSNVTKFSLFHLIFCSLFNLIRSREVHCDWEQGPSSKWQGEENPEASDHLLQSAAAGSAPALSADPVPGLTGASRPGGQTGAHPDSGGPSTHPVVLNGSGNCRRYIFYYIITLY